MPLVKQPIAFESVNFLPGFPGDSRYDCNPWQTSLSAGACGTGPVAVGRETGNMPASQVVARAMVAAGVAPPQVQVMVNRGIVPAGLAGLGGCGCGGSCGGGKKQTGGCGCGDHFEGRYGMGEFSTTDILDWVKSNALPLGIGAGLMFFLKRR